MSVKKIIALMLAFTLLLTLAACNKTKKADNSGTSNETEDKSGNLSILEPTSTTIKAWGYFDEIKVSEFIRDYPDYEVITDGVVGVFDVDKTVDLPRLASAIASGDQPDLFLGMMRPSEAYYTNLFDPVQPYLDIDPNYRIDQFDSGVFDMVTFNDVVYFIPVDFTTAVLCWNRDLYEELGMNPDTPPTTWDEFLEACTKLVSTDATGKIKSIGMDPSYPWLDFHLAAFGEGYVDKTGLNFNWNNDKFLETFELFKNLPNTHGGKDKLSGEPRFIFGQTGLTGWNGAALRVLSEWTSFEYGITTMPKYKADSELFVPASQGASYCIPKGAKNPAGGWLLGTYDLTTGKLNSELQNYYNNPVDFMPTYIIHNPTREKLYGTFEPLLEPELFDRMKLRDDIESKRNVVRYTSPVQSKLDIYFEKEYKRMLDSQVAPKDFLLQLQEYSETLVKEFLEQKTGENWVFEDGKDGIPPVTEQ